MSVATRMPQRSGSTPTPRKQDYWSGVEAARETEEYQPLHHEIGGLHPTVDIMTNIVCSMTYRHLSPEELRASHYFYENGQRLASELSLGETNLGGYPTRLLLPWEKGAPIDMTHRPCGESITTRNTVELDPSVWAALAASANKTAARNKPASTPMRNPFGMPSAITPLPAVRFSSAPMDTPELRRMADNLPPTPVRTIGGPIAAPLNVSQAGAGLPSLASDLAQLTLESRALIPRSSAAAELIAAAEKRWEDSREALRARKAEFLRASQAFAQAQQAEKDAFTAYCDARASGESS